MPLTIDKGMIDRQAMLMQMDGGGEPATESVAGPSRPRGFPWYRVGAAGVIGSNVFDAASTLHGWGHGDTERNKLIGNSVPRLLLTKGLGTAAELGLMYALNKSGHPKAAGILGLGMSGPPTVAGIYNTMIGQK